MHFEDSKISRLSDIDEDLFAKFISQHEQSSKEIPANFEDSYEYIRLYFDTGEWECYRRFDGESLIFFAAAGSTEKPDTVRFKIFKPLGADPFGKLEALIETLRDHTEHQITITCLPKEIANELKGYKKKQFRYQIFDLDEIEGLAGQRWKNVRQKITRFKRENPKVRIESLSKKNSEKAVHLVSEWRSDALHGRGFSYTQVEKSKFAARYYADRIDEKNLWAYVYFIKGKAAAFQLLYRIGTNSAANPIGLSDLSVDGLAEFSQVHAWTEIRESGIRYVNDGPSWRRSLEQFKKKFNPVGEQLVIECYV